MRLFLLLVGLLWPAATFAQATAQAPNALGSVTTPALTDQIPVCQTAGGCDLSLTKPLKNETAQQLLSLGACPVGMTCVAPPTGVAATDTANLQAAVNTGDFAIIQLLPGTYKTNADIVITHRDVSIKGWITTWGAGLGGSNSPYPTNTNVDCSGIPTTSGFLGGCFVVKNQNIHFSGFRIFANQGNGENCIAGGDAGLKVDGGMVLDYCFDGIVMDVNVGNTTGYTLNPTINNIYIPYSWQFAVYCNSSCTDYMFGPNIWTEAAGACWVMTPTPCNTGLVPGQKAAVYVGPNSLHGRTFSNFLGDGAPCLYDDQAGEVAFMNNECGNSILAILNKANLVQIVGNSGYYNYSSPPPAFYAYGTSNGVQITNNYFYYGYQACFFADPAASFAGATISNNYCNGNPLYADATSNALYDRYVNPHPNGGQSVANTTGTFAAPDWQSGFDVTLSLYHGSNTLPNPVYTSFGQKGTFTILQSAAGTDVIGTLGTAYLNAPAGLSTTPYATDIYPWTTNPQGKIVIGTKQASLTPNANLLTGGNAMTSGWTNYGLASFTANSVADPIGTTTGAKAVEDTSASNLHGVQQALSGMTAGTNYTCAVWYNMGSSNNRNFAFQIQDASSNVGWVSLDQTGTSKGNSGVGIVNWGLASTSGSWSRLFFVINTAAAPATLSLALYLYPSIYYTGDGTSGGYFWGPTCRAGTAP